jgi:hypothetical protein
MTKYTYFISYWYRRHPTDKHYPDDPDGFNHIQLGTTSIINRNTIADIEETISVPLSPQTRVKIINIVLLDTLEE